MTPYPPEKVKGFDRSSLAIGDLSEGIVHVFVRDISPGVSHAQDIACLIAMVHLKTAARVFATDQAVAIDKALLDGALFIKNFQEMV